MLRDLLYGPLRGIIFAWYEALRIESQHAHERLTRGEADKDDDAQQRAEPTHVVHVDQPPPPQHRASLSSASTESVKMDPAILPLASL